MIKTTAQKDVIELMINKKLSVMNTTRDLTMHQLSQCGSISEIEEFIKRRWEWFWLNGLHSCNRKNRLNQHELIDVRLTTWWNERIPNTYKNQVNGMHRFHGVPGWEGKLSYTVEVEDSNIDYVGRKYFNNTLINTRGKHYSVGPLYVIDLVLWAADFPVMYEQHRRTQYLDNETKRRQLAWFALGGTSEVPPATEFPEDWKLPDPLIPQRLI